MNPIITTTLSKDNRSAIYQTMTTIRTATLKDLDAIHQIEAASFPPAEAASYEHLLERLQLFADHFWVMELDDAIKDEPVITGFINGMVTGLDKIEDQMFENPSLHDNKGEWQSVLGLAVSPAFRNKGIATQLTRHLIAFSTATGKTGITLTCKEHLIKFYQKFGFRDAGLSQSNHGGAVWHDMLLRL
jgi:ribosomal protein S18 acetylase RimI-like enzyme